MARASILDSLTEAKAKASLTAIARKLELTIISCFIDEDAGEGSGERQTYGVAILAKTIEGGSAFVTRFELKYGRLWLSDACIALDKAELAALAALATK